MVVALIALFVALSGVTYAAVKIPKNSITSKQLKNGKAVKNVDVVPNNLTGSAINESTLGTVPSATSASHATSADSATNADHATNADTAANASQLGGSGPSAFLQNGATAGGDLTGTYPNPTIGAGKVTSGDFAPVAVAPFATESFKQLNATGPPTECCTETRQFFFKGTSDTGATPTTTSLSVDGILIKTGCNTAALNPVATVENDSGIGGALHGATITNASVVTALSNSNFGSTPVNIIGGTNIGSGDFTVALNSDKVVTVQYQYDNSPTFNGQVACTVNGSVIATAG